MANLSSHGVLLVAAGSILWGSSGIAGQYILQGQGISPEWLTFFRLFVAGSLLLLISHLMGKGIVSVWKSSAERLRLIIFGCLGMLGRSIATSPASRSATRRPRRFSNTSCRSSSSCGTACVKNGFRGGRKSSVRFRHRRYGPHRDSRRPDVSGASSRGALLGPPFRLCCALYTISPVGLILKYSAPVVVGWACSSDPLSSCP